MNSGTPEMIAINDGSSDLQPGDISRHLYDLLTQFVHKKVYDELYILIRLLYFVEKSGSICIHLDKKNLGLLWKSYQASLESTPDQIENTNPEKQISNICNLEFLSRNLSSIVSKGEKFTPFILLESKAGSYLYFQKNYITYKHLLDKKNKMLEYNSKFNAAKIHEVVKEVFEDFPIFKDNQILEYDVLQKMAIYTSLKYRFGLVSGGPGTGKTTMVLNLIRCMLRSGIDHSEIVLCAPTGRASSRLLERILEDLEFIKENKVDQKINKVVSCTIHKLLGHNPVQGSWKFNQQNPLFYKVVIIDESSMIDLMLMSRIFDAMAPGTHIILFGDEGQLPSIESGSVFSDFVNAHRKKNSKKIENHVREFCDIFNCKKEQISHWPEFNNYHLTKLTKSYRSIDSIVQAASMIKAGQYPDHFIQSINDYQCKDVVSCDKGILIITNDIDYYLELKNQLLLYSRHLFSEEYFRLLCRFKDEFENSKNNVNEILKYLDSMRILCLVNHGPAGQLEINKYLLDILKKTNPGIYSIPSGCPVIINKNNPDLGLYNGDIGVHLLDRNNNARIYFKNQNTIDSFSPEQIQPLQVAFAHTVHKSQGSEYDEIFLILPQIKNEQLFCRELLYTAITRSKRRSVVFGSQASLKYMIENSLQRTSGPIQNY